MLGWRAIIAFECKAQDTVGELAKKKKSRYRTASSPTFQLLVNTDYIFLSVWSL